MIESEYAVPSVSLTSIEMSLVIVSTKELVPCTNIVSPTSNFFENCARHQLQYHLLMRMKEQYLNALISSSTTSTIKF